MNEITWSWLGGFFQAEGCVSGRRLTLTQKDHRSLDLVRNFLISEFPTTPIPKVRMYVSPHNSFKPGSVQHELSVHTATPYVLTKLIPYLRCEKRRALLAKIPVPFEQQPLDDDWIVGFWEGDGSLWPNCLTFYQKDEDILHEVCDYLNLGHVTRLKQHRNIHCLFIPIRKSNVERIGELLSHTKSPQRLEQLAKIGI